MLTREAILACKDRKLEEVQVPEWGGSIFIRQLGGAQFLAAMQGNLLGIELLIECCVDENGDALFSKDDLEQLNEKNGLVLTRILGEALRINFLTADGIEEAGKD